MTACMPLKMPSRLRPKTIADQYYLPKSLQTRKRPLDDQRALAFEVSRREALACLLRLALDDAATGGSIADTGRRGGAVPASDDVVLRIEDESGVPVATLPSQTVTELAAGQEHRIAESWNTGLTLTGVCRARAVLYGTDGGTLDADQMDLRIRDGPDQAAPSADPRVAAGQASYPPR